MYVQAVAGEVAHWGTVEHLLASVIDSLTVLNHNLVQSRSKKTLPKPKFMTRPGMTAARKPRRQRVPLAETREFWNKRRRGEGG